MERFPVPAPATVELLQGAPVYSSGIQAELVTPTGAAIVKTLATRFGAFPEMKIEKSGYGAGTRDLPGQPMWCASRSAKRCRRSRRRPHQETISVLEANLDDLNPQVFGYVMDRLLEEGALDVFGMPVQMKKNRPGTLLTVLCKPEDAAQADADDFRRDHDAGSAAAPGTAADAGAALGNGGHTLGRGPHEDCQHERHGHQLRAGVRRLPPHRRRATCAAEDRDAGGDAGLPAASGKNLNHEGHRGSTRNCACDPSCTFCGCDN